MRCYLVACIVLSACGARVDEPGDPGAADAAVETPQGPDCDVNACPPPPEDWCGSGGSVAVPASLAAYWDTFCGAACGDGILSEGEACDDANAVSGDGCSETCAVEAGFECSTPGHPCVAAPTP